MFLRIYVFELFRFDLRFSSRYVEKRTLGFFWTRVDIGQPNNQWYDVVYDYMYIGSHSFQLNSHGTYRITVTYVISGTGGEPDIITRTITKTY